MDEKLYPMIFKRKSFHLFKNTGSISQRELSQIEDAFRRCQPLIPEIPVEMKIVPATDTTKSTYAQGKNDPPKLQTFLG